MTSHSEEVEDLPLVKVGDKIKLEWFDVEGKGFSVDACVQSVKKCSKRKHGTFWKYELCLYKEDDAVISTRLVNLQWRLKKKKWKRTEDGMEEDSAQPIIDKSNKKSKIEESSTPRAQRESRENLCKNVVDSQPHVLVIPVARTAGEFAAWKGKVMTLDPNSSSSSDLLPFVDRLPTLIRTVSELLQNDRRAKEIESQGKLVRSLHLVGSGALFGAGKTTLSSVLYQCLERELALERKVVFCQVLKIDKPYDMWLRSVARARGMEGIKAKVSRDMSWHDLLDVTADYLAVNNLSLFLHMDEFVPFDETGRVANTKESFYQCWIDMLMPILMTPGIFLYISGRLPYFDSIGYAQPDGLSPCSVLSVQLNLFSPDIILDMLRKISVPSPPGVKALSSGTAAQHSAATTTLPEVLDAVLPMTKDTMLPATGRAADIARRLHELTAGVPRFIEHSLYALLTNRAIHAAFFYGGSSDRSGDCSGDTDQHLDSLFGEGGALYRVVTDQAMIHFRQALSGTSPLQGGDQARDQARDEHVASLLVIAFLQGRVCDVELEDLEDLSSGMQATENPGILPFLLREALFWGFHRDVDLQGRKVKFPVPAAVLAGLKRVLQNFNTAFPPGLQKLTGKKSDVSGKLAEHNVEMALVFHRLMAGILEHHAWLGIDDSNSAVEPMALLSASAAGLTRGDSHGWLELPRLPRVHVNGQLSQVAEVEKVIYGSHGDAADTRMCPPWLAGEFISDLSADALHALATAPLSASADFIVRYGDDVTHLQVRDTQSLNLRKMLVDCGKVAGVIQGAPDLCHTLVWVMMHSDGLNDAATSLADMAQLMEGEWSDETIKAAVMTGKNKKKVLKLLKKYAGQQAGWVAAGDEGGIPGIGSSVEQEKRTVEDDSARESTVGDKAANPSRSEAEKNEQNVLAAVSLIRSQQLKLVVLDKKKRDEFLQYNEITKALLVN